MEPVTITLSTISIISLIIVASILKYQQIKMEKDYNNKLVTMAMQTNDAGSYEYKAIKTQQKDLNDLSHEVDTVKRTYVTKKALAEEVDTASAKVGVLQFSKNGYKFDNVTDSEGKKLKLDIPNKPGGGFRVVTGEKTLLNVNSTTGHVDVPEKINTNKIQLGNKWNISGVGDALSNDDWLRLMDKDGKNLNGGIATAKSWTRDASYMNNAYANKFTSVGGLNDSNWIEVQKKDGSIFLGADKSSRGIKSTGDRSFTVYTNDKSAITVKPDSSVETSKLLSTDINANSISQRAGNVDWFRINNNADPNSKGIALYNGVAINQGGGLSVGDWNKVPEGQAYIRDGLKIRHNKGDWTSNASLSVWAPTNTVGAAFGGPDQWSHLPWSDGNMYLRPGKKDGSINFIDANNINTQASNIALQGANLSMTGKNTTLNSTTTSFTGDTITTNAKSVSMMGSNLMISGSNITMKGEVSLTNNICLNGTCLSSSDINKIQTAIKPVDCKVSDWIPVGSCSKTCGTGTQLRMRSVIQPAMNGGAACPILSDTQPCNSNPCPNDCKVSEWSSWTMCDKPCGGGKQSRSRKVIQNPMHGGAECPALNETQQCNTQGCPVDCVVSDWSGWSACDKPCGGGSQTRTRKVVTEPANGGKLCPVLSESQVCNTTLCSSLDCQVSAWSAWSACVNGSQTRTRTVIKPAASGGSACPALVETQPCKVDCQVSDWSSWTQCSSNGIQTTTRKVTQEPLNGGIACPALSMSQPCKIDCKVSDWEYGSCAPDGTMIRKRKVTQEPINGGAACPPLTETIPCKVDCQVSDWSAWGQCGTDGTMTRTRTIKQNPLNGGTACPTLIEKTPCKVDCKVSTWTNGTCGTDGKQTNTRTVLQQPYNGGLACPNLSETVPCKVDCKVSDWIPGSCINGSLTATRKVIQPALNGGAACPPLTEVRQCPSDCVVSDWSSWSTCDKPCGTGTQTRTRTIQKQPINGGKACPTVLSESQQCNTQTCPVDCLVSDWSAWSTCDKPCGTGNQTRTRTIQRQAANGGKVCPTVLSESQQCNTQACITQPTTQTTTVQQPLTNSCSPGICPNILTSTNGMYKAVMQGDGNFVIYKTGGSATWSTGTIGTNALPHKAILTTIGDFMIIDSGNKILWKTDIPSTSRGIGPYKAIIQDDGEFTIVNSSTSTTTVGSTIEKFTNSINTTIWKKSTSPFSRPMTIFVPPPTPINCVVSNWSAWSTCDKPCGTGTQTRTRAITTQAANGGTACPTVLSESQQCNTQACPVDCLVSDWSAWSTCTKPCGTGTQTRTRTIQRQAANGGKVCPTVLSESQQCNTQACPLPGLPKNICQGQCPVEMISEKGTYKAVMQGDGNFVIYKVGGAAIWSTGTGGKGTGPYKAILQSTGELTINDNTNKVLWVSVLSAATKGTAPYKGVITDIGEFIIYNSSGTQIWNSSKSTGMVPIDCKVSDWVSGPCGSNGQLTMTRNILQQPSYGGTACPTLLTQTSNCRVDCKISDWVSGPCGTNGQLTMTRNILQHPLNGGTACPTPLTQTSNCKVDCLLSDWSAWGTCSNNTQTRTRTIIRQPLYGGAVCQPLSESQVCKPPGFSGSFKFTNVGATGNIGPTLAQCMSVYDKTVSQFMSMSTPGVQTIKLSAGSWRVTATGASSTKSGSPAIVETTFTLTVPTDVSFVVGQMGIGMGGSGGSFVFYGKTLIAAAGGAGGSGAQEYWWTADASITNSGKAGNRGINYAPPYNGLLGGGGGGGTTGNGGKGIVYTPEATRPPTGGGGGGGWLGDGTKGIGDGGYGYPSFVGGKNSGSGGFGGGGGGAWGGGGGGGYSGGGGGSFLYDAGTGGGGGSFGIGTPKISLLPATSVPAHGSVLLQKL